MKKIIIFSAVFLFLISFGYASSTFATDSISSDSAKTKSSYTLAYPGILPDNPFYKIKVLRDKIIELLTNDPVKKVDFYLLQTDKGFAATDLLVKKNKIELAKETGLKAEHNYTLLTYVVKSHRSKLSDNQFQKLLDASEKHQEILNFIIKSVPNDHRKTFQTILYFSKQNQKEVQNTLNTSRGIRR